MPELNDALTYEPPPNSDSDDPVMSAWNAQPEMGRPSPFLTEMLRRFGEESLGPCMAEQYRCFEAGYRAAMEAQDRA